MIGVAVERESVGMQCDPVVERECWLYAHVCDGRLFVYRSVLVRDTDPIFAPVRDLIGDSEPFLREMVTDRNMMLCKAIREIYDVQ
ncbi:hypothetical protein DDT46_00480 [Mycobacteroides abscessus]|uniref:Uncharacterized protein n=3 Tax=Mycobacteroides abscessus TaxID=36809 RepID=A0ABD7HGR1_9MYCO|nr:hypothetical protein DDT46_00480 [Mycobacteroides abscessus]RIT28646.1 hypothetical protein D2E76_27295 [Mycobacteroides abscessus]